MNYPKIIFIVIFIFFLGLFLHNAWYFPHKYGYDAGLHYKYLETIVIKKKIPTPEDTKSSYNPPLYYFLSSRIIPFFVPLFNGDLWEAEKVWILITACFAPLIGFFWFDIFRKLNPRAGWLAYLLLIWLLSFPTLNKMLPMYNYEVFQLILVSFTIWFFIKFFLEKTQINLVIWLGIFTGFLLLTRIMSSSLVLSIFITILLLWWWKKISFKKMLILNLIFILITLAIGGWFYYFYKDQGVFLSGENPKDFKGIPILKRQPRSFYTETFFHLSMKAPVRPNFYNRFIPIFYSDFWGDYWNYYRHRRFPLSPEEEQKIPTWREKISASRLLVLAWQNRINLIPTLIILAGFIWAFLTSIISIIKRSKNLTYQNISENFLVIFFLIAFSGFFYANLEFPNLYKGDTIKSAYILFAIPILFFFGTKFLMQLGKIKAIFYLLVIIVFISILFNLHFDYY